MIGKKVYKVDNHGRLPEIGIVHDTKKTMYIVDPVHKRNWKKSACCDTAEEAFTRTSRAISDKTLKFINDQNIKTHELNLWKDTNVKKAS